MTRTPATGWLRLLLLCTLILSLLVQAQPQPLPPDGAPVAAREAAVIQARTGELAPAITSLQALHQQFPQDPALLADLVTLLAWDGQYQAAADLAASLATPGPDWLYLPWARSLRNLGQYRQALAVLDAALLHWPATAPERQQEALLRILILTDAQQLAEAQTLLARQQQQALPAQELLLASAYLARRAGQPAASLAAAQQALATNPDQAEAYQHQVFALLELGAAGRALQLAQAKPDWFNSTDMARLQLAQAAQQLGWARLVQGSFGWAPQAADAAAANAAAQAEAQLVALLRSLPTQAPDLLPVAQEHYLLALFAQQRYVEVTALHGQMQAAGDADALSLPAQEAVADAWLYQREPKQAELLYREILRQDPWYYPARLGLYWALLDQDEYAAAGAHLAALAAEKPAFLATAPGQPGQPYWRRLELELALAMHQAMANAPASAQAQLEAWLAQAPASAQIRRELARVYRWRGWSARALEQAQIALVYEPEVVAGQVLVAQLQADLGQHAQADAALATLADQFPRTRQVQLAWQAQQDRQRWGFSASLSYGDSDGFAGSGGRDRSSFHRMHGPWLQHLAQHWQLYGWHYYSDASFPEGKARYDRLGAGVEWQLGRQQAYLETHLNRVGSSEPGLTLGYGRQLNDHWRLGARYDSFSTEVPLRARRAGLDGWSLGGNLDWRAHESRQAGLGVQQLAISDGNTRWGFSAYGTQRLRADAHHLSWLRLDLFSGRGSQADGPYFNPRRDAAAGLTLAHDWISWRAFERSLTQGFQVGLGSYWQDGAGAGPTALLDYEQRWVLQRDWRLRYGAGWRSQLYDGDRERRWHVRLQLEALL